MAKRGSLPHRLWQRWNGEFIFDTYFSRREKAQQTKNPILKLWYRHYCTKVNNRFCAFIPLNIKIPRSVTFPHGISGIYISVGAVIGENCTIFHQVTIGSNTLEGSRRQGSPALGENVFVGAGAKIIGGVTIGAGSRIAAGCAVAVDIPPNATVVPGAPRILTGDAPRENVFRTPPAAFV